MLRQFFINLFKKKIEHKSSETKLKVDFSYDNAEKDRSEIKRVSGLFFLNEVSHRPIEKPYFAFKIDSLTTLHNISLFLDTFPEDFQFSFFDNFYPQISDPGAYLTIQHYNNNFIYQLGNHGWSSEWKIMIKSDLIDYMYKNRGFQSDNYIEVYRRYKTFLPGQRL